MAMHTYKPPASVRLPRGELARQIAQAQARCIVALRLKHKLPRVTVVARTGINWKRIRGIEEGSQVASLDELVKLAGLYRVSLTKLIRQVMVGAAN